MYILDSVLFLQCMLLHERLIREREVDAVFPFESAYCVSLLLHVYDEWIVARNLVLHVQAFIFTSVVMLESNVQC